MPKVTLTDGTSFNCEVTASVLAGALQERVALEYSCRNGRCGICKTRLVSGETTLLSDESSLTDAERAEGYVLTCCRSAMTDLELDTEALGGFADFMTKVVPARIDSLCRVNQNVLEVVLRTPPNNRLQFVPGQYVDVIGPDSIRRSYSIANAPREDGKLVLYIRRVEGGQLSDYWFNLAKVNDLLRLEGPLGTFGLRAKPQKSLVFLATGTGIAPIKAMLESLSVSVLERWFDNIFLYWGGRNRSDFFWTPKFPTLPVSYHPVVSRQADWPGKQGYVQHALLADDISLEEACVYACGSPAMIQAARLELATFGFDLKNFYSDAFVSSDPMNSPLDKGK